MGHSMSPALILAILIAVSVLVGFGGGWGVKGWKDGAAITTIKAEKAGIESENAILQAANGKCTTDIKDVQTGVGVILARVADREKAAADAMAAADAVVAQRSAKIKTIRAMKEIAPAPKAQCDAIIQEQIEYVQGRKDGD